MPCASSALMIGLYIVDDLSAVRIFEQRLDRADELERNAARLPGLIGQPDARAPTDDRDGASGRNFAQRTRPLPRRLEGFCNPCPPWIPSGPSSLRWLKNSSSR